MEKSSKRVTIFAIILSLVAVGVLVFGFLMVSSSRVVMLQSISNLYGKLTDLPEDTSSLIDKLSQSNDVGLKGDLDIKIGKSKYIFNLDYLENKKDSKSSLSVVGKKGEKEIINGNMYYGDNTAYMFLNDITPNYYKVASRYYSIFKSINSDDYDKLVSLLKDSIDSSIKSEDILKEKETIILNGKSKKVNKLTYAMTTKKVEEILTKFIKSIKADKALLNDLSNYLDISNKELKTRLDNILKKVKANENKELFRYQVYYYGLNKIVQYEIYNKDTDLLIQYKVDGKEYLNITAKNTNYLKLEVEKNKKTYNFSGTLLDTYDFNGTFSDNLLELIFKFDKEYKLDIVYSNNRNNFKSLYQITLSSNDGSNLKELFLITANLEYYFGDKVDSKVDTVEATTLDQETLNNILETNFGVSLENIQNIYSNIEEKN